MITTARYSHLKRERLRLENGDVLLRAPPKYIDSIIDLMDMRKAKAAKTPSLMEDDDGLSAPLDDGGIEKFRSAVGILLYINVDRDDIQRDVQLLSRCLREPSQFDWRRLVKLVRYLKGHRNLGIVMKKPKNAKKGVVVMDMYTDTDFVWYLQGNQASHDLWKSSLG